MDFKIAFAGPTHFPPPLRAGVGGEGIGALDAIVYRKAKMAWKRMLTS